MAKFNLDILAFMKAMAAMNVCVTCGTTFSGKSCSTCEATAHTRGDAFTTLCSNCMRGFATSDPSRDLCCFCLRRQGAFYGRNRRANQTPSRRSPGAAHSGPGAGTMSHNALTSPGTLGYTRARPEPAIESAGIRSGEIIAWRAWRLCAVDKKLMLKSMAMDCLWMPGATMTINSVLEQCGIEQDRWERVPPSTGAGIHAFKTLDQAVSNYGGYHRTVYGTVALWGEVIEHTGGYRAEFARLNTIDHIDGQAIHDLGLGEGAEPVLLEALRENYGVKDKSYKDFKIGT